MSMSKQRLFCYGTFVLIRQEVFLSMLQVHAICYGACVLILEDLVRQYFVDAAMSMSKQGHSVTRFVCADWTRNVSFNAAESLKELVLYCSRAYVSG